QRADERKLGCALPLGEPPRIQRVDSRHHLVLDLRRHAAEQGVDVGHRTDAAGAGNDRLAEGFELLGVRIAEHGHRSRFSRESHFEQLAYSASTSGPVSPGMSGLTVKPFRVWR